MDLTVYCDGGSLGNQGPDRKAYYSFKIYDGGIEVKHVNKKDIPGNATNNEAEYQALIQTVEYLLHLETKINSLTIYTDSQLVVKQLSGEYKVRNPNLLKLHEAFKNKCKELGTHVTIVWVSRDVTEKELGH